MRVPIVNCIKNSYQNRVSFGNKSQEPDIDDILEQNKSLKRDLDIALRDLDNLGTPITWQDIDKQTEISDRLAGIRKSYSKIGELLDAAANDDDKAGIELIKDFLSQRDKMGSEKGFNKIIGCDDIKTQLDNDFSINTILKAQLQETSGKIKGNKIFVPNSLLFYGPTGCGKSFFAGALAEQAIMNIYRIDTSTLDEKSAYNLMMEFANQSKEFYKNSSTKQRSVILLDEADSFLDSASPILKEFQEFMKNCAEKYKCTLFLTTNSPLDISPEILSSITLKTPIPIPTAATTKEFLRKKISAAESCKDSEITRIVSELFKNPSQVYSYRDLKILIETTMKKNNNLKPMTILQTILRDNFTPSISSQDILNFKNVKRILK